MRIGFVGLGAMGLPMASRLARAGHEVAGYDVRADRAELLAPDGGRAAGSVAEASRGAEALVLMVVNMAQAEAVLLEGGALDALPEGAAVILMATCAPGAVEALAARVEAAGRRFVDAPVSGGVPGAREGTLTVMAAAPAPLFDEVRPVLETMGSRLYHVGERAGQGATVKAINQLLCGVHIAAAAEALSLAQAVGVEPGVVAEIVGGSAASSWMLRDRAPRMLQGDPPVASAVDIFVKDLGIVLAAGEDARAALPLAAAARQMFLAASGRGLGPADDSQVIAAYRALSRREGGS